jgi:peptidase E
VLILIQLGGCKNISQAIRQGCVFIDLSAGSLINLTNYRDEKALAILVCYMTYFVKCQEYFH